MNTIRLPISSSPLLALLMQWQFDMLIVSSPCERTDLIGDAGHDLLHRHAVSPESAERVISRRPGDADPAQQIWNILERPRGVITALPYSCRIFAVSKQSGWVQTTHQVRMS